MTTVGEDFPKQQARVREILKRYQNLPNNAGIFASTIIEHALTQAEEAQASGDLTRVLHAYITLTHITE